MAQYEAMVVVGEQDNLTLIVDAECVSSAVVAGSRARGVDGHIGAAVQQEAVINEVAVSVIADDVTTLIDTIRLSPLAARSPGIRIVHRVEDTLPE